MTETTSIQEEEKKGLFELNVLNKTNQAIVKSIDADGDGVVTVNEIVEHANKTREKTKAVKKWRTVAIVMLILLVITVIIIFALIYGITHHIFDKDDATDLLGETVEDIMTNTTAIDNTSNYSLSADTKKSLIKVFKTFDSDNDNLLNLAEFQVYMEHTTDPKQAIRTLDANGDGVWSYREIVGFFVAINSTASGYKIINDQLSILIKGIYNYSFNVNDLQWFEYAAILYLDFYGFKDKGFISSSDYIFQRTAILFPIITEGYSYINSSQFINGFSSLEVNKFIESLDLFNESISLGFLNISSTWINKLDLVLCVNDITSITDFSSLSFRRRMDEEACLGSVIGCVVAGVAGVFSCIVSAGFLCGPVVGVTAGVCVPALGTCAAALIYQKK